MRDGELLALVAVFVPFSLLSFGGGNVVIAGIQQEAVTVHQWVTAGQFIELFAISRAAPGPGSMLATLVGWNAAGYAGAVVATAAFFGPSSLLCLALQRAGQAHRGKLWYRAIREGLAPVGIGLTIAAVVIVFRLAGGGPLALAIAVGAAALLGRLPRLPTLLVLLAGGGVMTLASLPA